MSPAAPSENHNRFLTCQDCANACRLSAQKISDDSVVVRGNRCERGIAYVKRRLGLGPRMRRTKSGRQLPVFSRGIISYPVKVLKVIAGFWDLDIASADPDAVIAGSPERTDYRVLVTDHKGKRFVMEQVPHGRLEHKRHVAEVLACLTSRGVPHVQPYLASHDGRYQRAFEGDYWQVIPFVEGVPLNRRRYLFEGWRGKALADFLVSLHHHSARLPDQGGEEVFSVKKYIERLLRQISRHHAQILPKIIPAVDFLEKTFMPVHDTLPVGFCHGDYHPLNIIWGRNAVQAVIDWEFMGKKPQAYDAANMVGCLGIEDPESLSGNMVRDFLTGLRSAKIFSDKTWEYFFELVIAVRFAWLSEWLRKQDGEMIEMEGAYLHLLVDHVRSRPGARGW